MKKKSKNKEHQTSGSINYSSSLATDSLFTQKSNVEKNSFINNFGKQIKDPPIIFKKLPKGLQSSVSSVIYSPLSIRQPSSLISLKLSRECQMDSSSNLAMIHYSKHKQLNNYMSSPNMGSRTSKSGNKNTKKEKNLLKKGKTDSNKEFKPRGKSTKKSQEKKLKRILTKCKSNCDYSSKLDSCRSASNYTKKSIKISSIKNLLKLTTSKLQSQKNTKPKVASFVSLSEPLNEKESKSVNKGGVQSSSKCNLNY